MICPFCEKDVERFKTNSHVVPKWMHKPTFEGNNGFYSFDLQKEEAKKVQDGYKSSFICDACEDLFEKDDTFASQFFVDRKRRKNTVTIADAESRVLRGFDNSFQWLFLDGVDFKKVQKFIFGIFLRSYMAKTEAA